MTWPRGTEDRCCFVCKHSSTNTDLLADPEGAWSFTAKTRREWVISCRRYQQNVLGYEYCTGFEER